MAVRYCNKCGRRYTIYVKDEDKLCAECKAKRNRAIKFTPEQIYSIWMNHAH